MSVETIDIQIKDQTYSIEINFDLICEIENECGALIQILNRFQSSTWKITEIVHILHIMIGQKDENLKYEDLGDSIIKAGAARFFEPILKLLSKTVLGI